MVVIILQSLHAHICKHMVKFLFLLNAKCMRTEHVPLSCLVLGCDNPQVHAEEKKNCSPQMQEVHPITSQRPLKRTVLPTPKHWLQVTSHLSLERCAKIQFAQGMGSLPVQNPIRQTWGRNGLAVFLISPVANLCRGVLSWSGLVC